MGNEIRSKPEFINLSKRYEKRLETFYEREKLLYKELFGELDKEKRKFEEPLEKEFLSLWNKYMPKGYSLNKFRFDFKLKGFNNFLVMGLTTPRGTFDLEKIALTYPEERREDSYLSRNDENYDLVTKKMKDELKNLGFYRAGSPIEMVKLKEFINSNGILFPKARYFTLP